MLYRNICQCCGGTVEKTGDKYVCKYCDTEFSIEKFEDYAEKISQLFDEFKLAMISNARKNLYKAITAQYISSAEVYSCCLEIKKYLPDDFQANFYDSFINKPKREVAQMIRQIDVKEQFELLESLIIFVINSLEKSYIAAIKDVIERAYILYKQDMAKYVKYTTLVENEAEKLDKCIYDTKLPRKAFVAYSSKDRDKAIELVEWLESQDITCFISLRNLRHGVGSQENYDKALKEAMDNCMSFIFVSSMNSRNIECDAYQIEMPYIMQTDKSNAPGQYRNFYTKIPNEYKKPRVEYRIEESDGENFADVLIDEFFNGYERAYTIKDVALRIIRQIIEMEKFVSNVDSQIEHRADISKLSDNQVKEQRKAEIRNENEKRIAVKKERQEKSNRPSSLGLEFILNKDGKSYTLKGHGSCREKDIVIGDYNGLPVTMIDNSAFYENTNIRSVFISSSITSMGNCAFRGCVNLTNISVDANNAKYKSIDGNLYTKDEKTLVRYAIGKKDDSFIIPNSVTCIFDCAFWECKNLTSITIPNGVTNIGSGVFLGCENLTGITIPDSVTSIGSGAFRCCNNLTSIKIPNRVKHIDDWTFFACRNLTSVIIPSSVTSISACAFMDCNKLKDVYCFNNFSNIKASQLPKNAQKLCYSETKPPLFKIKRYWHYVDGVPAEW